MNDDSMRLRSGQESSDHLQNIRIALRGVVKSRGIDESYTPSVKSELVCELDLGCTRPQAHPDPQAGTTC